MPSFAEMNRRHEANLDGAYNALLESREAELLEREALEDLVLTDREEFARLAIDYAKASLNINFPKGFLDFAVDQLQREREPQFTRGWDK